MGVGIETVRYYERLGILPEPKRDSNGYRIYSEVDAARLDHILRIKKYGFSLKEIKTAMDTVVLNPENIKQLLEKKAVEIERKIAYLQTLRNGIREMIASF